MDQSFQDLISILSDYIYQNKTDITPSKEVLHLASIHQLEGIIAYQCKGYLQNILAANLFLYQNRLRLHKEINEVLEINNIDYFYVKGIEVAKYYPVPALRTMGDSDIVVKEKEKACHLLETKGYKIISQGANEWVVQKSNMEFEIHDHLIYPQYENDKVFYHYFLDCFDHVSNHSLDWNVHFIFLLIHLRKHIIHSGAGIRQFMDLAILIEYNQQSFNWKYIEQELEKLDLIDFYSICLYLIHRWFNIQVPVYKEMMDENTFEQLTASIMNNGVFGFNDENNQGNLSIYAVGNQNYSKNMLINIVNNLFPDYKTMCTKPYGHFIADRPYLLPIAWLYRFYYCLFKENKIHRMFNKLFISKKQIQDRNEYLRKWGLK